MTMHKTLQPNENIERFYVARKEERILASVKNGVDASTQAVGSTLKRAKKD